ncbi:hypothetical protein [Streptomyces cavernicola]|uniref:DUF393 domain-containing protein n=1 Tax=Streptomyces cavernicola TaxID=3043613 RepID=A0ABT6SIW3_9ACTN|nr:hypothetical protein [Streptomyces sp. B-S-A6]MDI3408137.1 hypothetical protein [Streptomyces sp. B-S-A6]
MNRTLTPHTDSPSRISHIQLRWNHTATLRLAHTRFAPPPAERARQASLLGVFVGRDGMRDLGLRWRLPWALLLSLAGNTMRYRVFGLLPGGRRRIEARGARVQDRQLASMFPGGAAAVGELPGP